MPSQAKRRRQKQGKAARAEAIRIARQRERRRRSAIRSAFAIVVIVGVFALIANVGGGKKNADSTTTTTTLPKPTPPQPKPLAEGKSLTGDTPCPKADGSSERTTKIAKVPPMCIDPAKKYTATFDTTEGKIVVDLDTKTTPKTSNIFVVLARYHFYDGTSFYRTDTSLNIIQGGIGQQLGRQREHPGFVIKDEGTPPFHYTAGEMVVTRGNGPDSGGSDIFFTTQDENPGLDASGGTYVPLGKVTTGLDVVTNILALNVDDLTGQIPGGGPSRVVTIKTITITES
ncbi:MAG: peptidyl-prolyl cis-trans isomerase [Actinomycetota bacterium]|nr:peptidyl-prolyl cis-trans isomerase [Actinomycetota bacterium]